MFYPTHGYKQQSFYSQYVQKLSHELCWGESGASGSWVGHFHSGLHQVV